MGPPAVHAHEPGPGVMTGESTHRREREWDAWSTLRMTRFSWITRRIAPTRACPGVLCAALLGLLWLSPAPTQAAPAAPVGQGIHVVIAGDTLWSIAARHDTSVEAIAGANRLASIHRLQIGDVLKLTPRTVVRMNALTDEGRLRVGQVLNLPVPPPARGSRTPSVAAMPAVRPRFGWPSPR